MGSDPLGDLNLLDFQRRTVHYAHERLFGGGQRRFLVADEVGLGKTKVAQGVIALATAKRSRNVLYIASSGHIITQNLHKLATRHVAAGGDLGSLSLLAERVHQEQVRGQLIGLTPIKDLRSDHFGSVHERGLIFKLLRGLDASLAKNVEIRAFFAGSRANPETFEYYCRGTAPPSLQAAFERQLNDEVLARLRSPLERSKHKRAIVGWLRAVLAKCALDKLNPALVVVDEIQRFSADMMAGSPTPQVRYLLERPMLVLSATPYQADAPGHKPDAHKGFLELVRFLNGDQSRRLEDVEAALAQMRAALSEPVISRVRVKAAAEALERPLRLFMVRTERPRDAHVERESLRAGIAGSDLKALRQAMKLAKEARPSSKGKRHRAAELVELWKSAPYLVSALGDRYVTGGDFKKLLDQQPGRRLPSPAALTSAQLDRKTSLGDPAHPRLRCLVRAMGRDAQERRLWLPPTLPYTADLRREHENPPTKTLVFTSWSAAPPAIATALNLLVEPRPGRKRDLELSRTNKRSGQPEPVRSVYALAAPLWRFAKHSDPFEAMRCAGRSLAAGEMVALVRQQLVDAELLVISRAARAQNTIDAAIALNAQACYPIPTHQTAYLHPARKLMQSIPLMQKATVTSGDANDLAELAAAAPGTCAYRALRRAIPTLAAKGKCDESRDPLFGAAIAIGNSLTRWLQRPATVAIIEGSGSRKKAPFWRKVLRYCLENDLQSVLDEYIFLLARDSPERNPDKLAADIAQTIDVALSTVGGLQVVRPKRKPGVAMYARALGEHDSPSENDATSTRKANTPRRARGRHANPLLTAFNSPFPPFVLASTSTGQEGLDMHRYCRRLAHWNLPSSPLALEQREGRIDRYLSLGVRTNIAKLGIEAAPRCGDISELPAHPWESLLKAAQAQAEDHQSVLAPLWHFGRDRPIKALAINVAFSREEGTWQRLQEEASWYRLVLGQPDPRSLLDRLANGSDHNRREIDGISLHLNPAPQISDIESSVAACGDANRVRA